MSNFKVGDTVILTRERFGHIEATVTKVGRRWVTVDKGHHYQRFDKDSGREDTQYGSPQYIYTPAGWEEVERRAGLVDRLRNQSHLLAYHANRIPLDTLEQIVALLESVDQ